PRELFRVEAGAAGDARRRNMLDLMRNGGFPMWIILLFGLLALGSAARYALRPDAQRVGFIKAMGRATLFATLAGTAADLGAVFIHLSGEAEVRAMGDWHW